jgi:murein DD-endopeptidase MepM/ murein hydrolase activator NlpD
MASRAARLVAALIVACLVAPAVAAGAGNVNVAALQVALLSRGLSVGTIDGYAGPRTTDAVRALERRHGLPADGIAGARVRRLLGRLGRPPLGSRTLHQGDVGWDVSALQFRLAWHGFPSGNFDGGFGPQVQNAVEGFQRWAGLSADGIAGPATLRSLSDHPIPSCPIRLARPSGAAIGDGFGPRGNRFHTGLDFEARFGSSVRAAAGGRVAFVGWFDGYGNLVVVHDGLGVSTWYAHLSSFAVRRGEQLGTGALIGRVGATGDATGPHLHFEVRVRGAAVNPLGVLG